jgi:DNA-binding CsgD family transcriptional regulator
MQTEHRESICPDIENPIFDIIGFEQGITPEELNDHVGFVKQLVASKSPADLKKCLLKIFSQFGFSDFSFTGFSHDHKPHFFLTSLPEELLASYQDQHLYKFDLALDYLKADNPTHFHHSDIQQIIEGACFLTQTFDKNQQILDLYKKFEFNNAYLMPYKNNRDEIANKQIDRQKKSGKNSDNQDCGYRDRDGMLFSLMAKGATQKEFMTLTEPRSAVLHLLGDTAIRAYQNNFNSHNPAPRIDTKPIEFLTIMATSDLSLSQAADKLCISLHTANKYMATAKKMLGTGSQANATYRALQQGLIDF